MNKVHRWVFQYVGNKTFDFSSKKKDFLPKNDQIWPRTGIFGQFGPGHAGLFSALLVGPLVVVARGLYLARHLFTLCNDHLKHIYFEEYDILPLRVPHYFASINWYNIYYHIVPCVMIISNMFILRSIICTLICNVHFQHIYLRYLIQGDFFNCSTPSPCLAKYTNTDIYLAVHEEGGAVKRTALYFASSN